MGKKAKKKSRPSSAVKRVNSPAKKDVPHPENASDGIGKAAVVQNGTVRCNHAEKGFDLNVVSAKIGSADPVDCEDCRGDSVDKTGGRGKAKPGKKKGGSPTATWICLLCGHYSCGGIGFPTNAQCHAKKHARETRHPMVIQFEKPNLRWCFRCNAPIPMEKGQESQENEDIFVEVVKLIRQRSGQSPDVSADVEDAWFGSGSVMSEVKSCNYEVTSAKNGGGGLAVRGLVNLGNTCFFNSVMQNLLAIDRLRDYLSQLSTSTGPLTASLKKLFSEVHAESGARNVVNPKGLFGNLCVKAPQFKGYQQHDSHELLRCLLDGLSTEEFDMTKRVSSDKECQSSPSRSSTFVDAIFGGQISSTVCCMECGHSSTVYEPFLDLSLPVPTKKPAPMKSTLVSRAKKVRVIPKRGGKVRARTSRETEQVASSAEAEDFSGDSRPKSSFESTVVDEGRLLSQDSSSVSKEDETDDSITMANEPVAAAMDGNSGLDYLNTESTQDAGGFVSCNNQSNAVHAETLDHLSNKGNSGLKGSSMTEPDIGENVEEVTPLENLTWLDYTAEPDRGEIVEQEVVSLVDSKSLDYKAEPETGEMVEEAAPLDNSTWLDYLCDGPMEDEICYSSRENDAGFTEHYGLTDCGFAEDASKDVDQVSRNSWEDEPLLPVIGPGVLLLPYKDELLATGSTLKEEGEASSTGFRQDEPEFDGFGDLFEEPDVVYGPVQNPNSYGGNSNNNDNADSTFMGENSSGSDAGEVDNSDSPVSVESCLTHFTKQELLLNDDAWHCEKCSKNLWLETKRKKLEEATGRSIVCRDYETSYSPTSNGLALSSGREDANFRNGKIHLVLQNHEDSKDENRQMVHHATRASDGIIGQSGQVDFELDGESETSFGDDDNDDSKIVKVKRDATKRVLIYKAPPVLTVHLKRFSQDARGRLSKLSGHVNFQEAIDLTPYLNPRGKDCEKYVYQLVGVVEHSGVMRGGHYVAYVRGGRREKADNASVWYYASDTHIREVTLQEVLRSDAYILFYELV
ncbi:hypothetical protein MLD38_027193 [Melastoma candidum]|uniref:Uncharacterized protein n=1 Tax=Melastoma candidum TaxID=119954 RepID=A0ACB9P2U9_9MYRT|nr:hypothetical protein MLD38_027193 [Melastoma candidum]